MVKTYKAAAMKAIIKFMIEMNLIHEKYELTVFERPHIHIKGNNIPI